MAYGLWLVGKTEECAYVRMYVCALARRVESNLVCVKMRVFF